jgi:hypothetical protein
VTVDAAGWVAADGGSVLAGPVALPGCRSRQAVTTAPAGVGGHEITVFRRSTAGWQRVAVTELDVK